MPTTEEAISTLQKIKTSANQLTNSDNAQFGIFMNKSLEMLSELFGENDWRYKQFKAIEWHYNPGIYFTGMDLDGPARKIFQEGIISVNTLIDDTIRDIESGEIKRFPQSHQDREANTPKSAKTAERRRVFITHGSSNDWQEVQRFIERSLQLETVELAETLSRGKTVIEKLESASEECFYAVIVMTGDDIGAKGQKISDESANIRVRENVMHEIGYFQGKLGRGNVILLHEEGVSMPSNLQGIVYEEFPKGFIRATFEKLRQEIDAAK